MEILFLATVDNAITYVVRAVVNKGEIPLTGGWSITLAYLTYASLPEKTKSARDKPIFLNNL
jgi:hypothetical protein